MPRLGRRWFRALRSLLSLFAMKIVHLTPGTGNFHCGSCLRDNHLVKALRALGHDVTMVPLYLPLVTDGEPASGEAAVQVGGINLYLRQKLAIFRWLPRFLFRILDAPGVLRAAADRASMTSARELGAMTVETLRGQNGRQAEDWQRLVEWIGAEGKPDVVSLSNGLLSGLAPAIVDTLGVPVLCSLQGEDSFLDTLPEPYQTQAWEAFRSNNSKVARYLATSDYYRGEMQRRLGLEDGEIVTVRNGMDFAGYGVAAERPGVPTIGYLARLCAGKGLATLVEAFVELAPRMPEVRLALGGTSTAADGPFIAAQQARLARAGLAERVSWQENLSFAEKVSHLQSLSVLSVPATYGEAFGLYVIEALACGVPVVEPDHAGLAEVVRATGGGVLCAPGDASALAEALEALLRDEPRRMALGERGRAAVLTEFSAERMARDFAAVAEGL